MLAQKIVDSMDRDAIETALAVEQSAMAREAAQARASTIVSALVFGEKSPEFQRARIRHLSALVAWTDAHLAGGPDAAVDKLRSAYTAEIARLEAK